MFKVIKDLKKFIPSILLIVVLLGIQAYCDLALPSYTSNIINVGVQQNGIEEKVPKQIKKESLDNILIFSDKKDKILDCYKLKGDKYVLKANAKTESIEKDFDKSIVVYTMLTSNKKEAKTLQTNIRKQMPTYLSKMDLITIFKSMNDTQLASITKTIDKKFKDMPDTIISQMATSAIKDEYTKLGINTNKLQTNYIIVAGLKMLGIALISMVMTVLVGYIGSIVSAKYAKGLRKRIYNKILHFSKASYKKFGVASLITRSTNDIQQIQMVLVMLLRIAIYAPILGIGGVIKILNTNTSMAWIIAVVVGLILTIISVMFISVMPRFTKLQKLIDKLNQVTREIITGTPVIRAFSNQKHEEKRFAKANSDLKKTTLFVDRAMALMMPTMMFIMNGICILIVWNSAHSINDGLMQVGDMLAFIQYTMQIAMAFLMISMFSIMLPRAGVSANRIFEVLETKDDINEKDNPVEFDNKITGEVVFNKVSFKYPDSDEEVIEDISFKAKKGDTIAFIGSTGSGKSTIVNLIPRFYDVTKGSILIDGKNIKDVKLNDLHQKIGYVPQKGVLFSGTIESNIKYGNPSMSDDSMYLASDIAQATEFVKSKKEKYKSPISQGGTNVSGGQKQRLSIARAIAYNPEILIFDDSFSALDFKTDHNLRAALNEKTKNKTVFIVAQRVSTIMHATQIIVLDEGKVVGKGTHEELLKTCEIYKEIATSQLTKEELNNV